MLVFRQVMVWMFHGLFSLSKTGERLAARLTMTALLITCGALASSSAAAKEPETLLAQESVLYVRYDGLLAHRESLNKTALGELFREEFQPLLTALSQQLLDALGPNVVTERMLDGARPDQLFELTSSTKLLPGALAHVRDHGLVLGVELSAEIPPSAQITVVLPEAGRPENRETVVGAIKLAASLTEVEWKQTEIQGRDVMLFKNLNMFNLVQIACWAEEEHLVITVGTTGVDHTLELVDDTQKGAPKRENFTANPLFQQLNAFQEYETFLRGVWNVQSSMQLVRTLAPRYGKVFEKLGLADVTRATLHLGCEGTNQCNTLAIHTSTDERNGVLALLAPPEAELTVSSVVRLPPDATLVWSGLIDSYDAYETLFEAYNAFLATSNPNRAKQQLLAHQNSDKEFGLDIQTDILDLLGPQFVVFRSPSEGPFMLGASVAIQCQDSDQVALNLKTLLENWEKSEGSGIKIQKRDFHGVTLYMMKSQGGSSPYTPTFAVCDGWLLASMYTQPIQGFVLRAEKKYAAWQPDSLLTETIRKLATTNSDGGRARLLGFTQSDPRPTTDQLLSVLPALVGTMGGQLGLGKEFDNTLLPNAQAIRQRLGPSVGLTLDDGHSIRWESRSLLPLPLGASGIESYFLLLISGRFGF